MTTIAERFAKLSTPLVADACVRLDVPVTTAPPGIRSLIHGSRLIGRALPAQHCGSVDVFFEALEAADDGDVLVIDNRGRLDEGCIGDLIVLESLTASVCGIAVWGVHRDSPELERIGLPVFSYGSCAIGPLAPRPRPVGVLRVAGFGDVEVTRDHAVVGDDDGIVFVPFASVDAIVDLAEELHAKERKQVERIRGGENLRAQFRFAEFRERRHREPSLTFRAHLREIRGAIEE